MVHSLRVAHKEHQVLFDLLLLTLIYTLAHGLMLFNQGIFWDDWALYNKDREVVIDMFRQAGGVWVAYLHLLVRAAGPYAYRAVAFASYLLSAWCVYGVLVEMKIARYSCFFVALIFALYPVNSARTAMIVMPYSVCYALFFCGFWLTATFLQTRNCWCRAAALALLFVSFATNSLLAFYLLIILYIVYRERPNPMNNLSGWLHLVLRYADYLLLPILFWIVKSIFMKPYGAYAGYNQVTSEGFSQAFSETLRVFDLSFTKIIDESVGVDFFSPIFAWLTSIHFLLPLVAVFLTIAALFLVRKNLKKVDREFYQTLWLFFFGALAYWLAAFPYVVVGKLPQSVDWDSRHQLLLPLGAALMLVYGIKLLIRHKAVTVPAYLLLASMFVQTSIMDHLSFQRDWYKQISLINNFRMYPPLKNNTSFLFSDDTRHLNANNRHYRYYEYSGLMKEAFGDETRFGHELRPYLRGDKKISSYKSDFTSSNNLSGFIPKEPDTFVTIIQGETDVSTAGVLKLMLWEQTDPEMFSGLISDIVRLDLITEL